MIVYLRTSAAGFDIRLRKYLQACESSNTPCIAITWNRLMNAGSFSNEFSYQHAAPYGYGHRLNNCLLLLGWYFFAFKHLFAHRKDYTVIHACNLETVPLAYLMKILFRKKVIFDIYDTSGYLSLERFFIRHSDMLILPTERRLEQEKITPGELKNYFTVENVPVFETEWRKCDRLKDKNRIVISYVGSFQRSIRGLENLLEWVLNDNRIVLELAGTGDGLELDFTEAAKNCSRIHYHGVVAYTEALEIMGGSDLIYAQYYMSAPVHKYASPNKFYESLFLGVPIITTKGTLVGDLVAECNTGYVIGESVDELYCAFGDINDEFATLYHEKEDNARMKWEKDYKSYFVTHMVNEYIMKCKSL